MAPLSLLAGRSGARPCTCRSASRTASNCNTYRPVRSLPVTASSRHAAPSAPRRRSVAAGFFKFGKNGLGSEDAGIYGSQGRDDYSNDDVEHYFNYMGMLAVEGTYDRMEALLGKGLEPVDVLLLMAASENDLPKVEELLRAGASVVVTDLDGKTPVLLATKPEVVSILEAAGGAVKA